MIGFFQNTMAKHHKSMFAFLLVIIVVSFVFYTGSGSAMDLLGFRKSPTVCGIKLNDREADVYRAAVSLQLGGRNASDAQYVQTLAQRIFLVNLAEKYQIPLPTQTELDEYTQNFFSRFTGGASPSREIVESIKRNLRLDDDGLKTLIVHDWKVDRLIKMLVESPAMLEEDIALRWVELNTAWTVETARISAKTFAFSAEPTDEELSAYYASHGEEYRIAPLMKLAFARVKPAAGALANVPEPAEDELKMFVAMNVPGLENDAAVAAELAKTRPNWIARWKKDRVATDLASATSDMLADKLPQDVVNPQSPDFEKSLAESGLELTKIPAFPQNKLPENSGVPAEILGAYATTLNNTGWRTDAIPSGEDVFVLIFLGSEPSRVPELAEVRADVVSAWKNATRDAKFFESAAATGAKLREAVAAGKPFAETAKSLGMETKTEAAFTMQNIPADLRTYGASVIENVKKLPLRTVSEMLRADDSAVFAYATKKDVPELDKNSETYKSLVNYASSMAAYQTLQTQLGERLAEIYEEVAPREPAQ